MILTLFKAIANLSKQYSKIRQMAAQDNCSALLEFLRAAPDMSPLVQEMTEQFEKPPTGEDGPGTILQSLEFIPRPTVHPGFDERMRMINEIRALLKAQLLNVQTEIRFKILPAC
jgi:hypothetical protein